MIELFSEVFEHAIMITGFVFVMMLVIEYVNVQTRGSWHFFLQKRRWLQYVFAAFLGTVPGCLGAFTVVALFSHKILSFGALVAAMIATSGDEAFVMLAMFPGKALQLFAITFIIGIIAGFLTDTIFPKINFMKKLRHRELPLHEEERCDCFSPPTISNQLRHPTMPRVLLIIIVLMLITSVLQGYIAHEAQNWIKVTLLITSVIALFVVITVPDHFLEEHLWNHIVKIHIPKIFLWTFGALLIIQLILQKIDLASWVSTNQVIVILIACLVGLIPESGPHLVFVSLFATGSIPFSVLLASSIVQDGHGMIPLLAETKRGFLAVKAVNIAFGLLVGIIGLLAGF